MKTDRHKSQLVPNLRFPGFEAEWKEYVVSEMLSFFSTNSLSWDQLEYKPKGIQNIHYGLIHNGLPTCVDISSSQLPVIKAKYCPKTYTLCIEGDIVFADASEDTNDVAKAIELTDCRSFHIVCGLHTIHGRDKLNITEPGFKGYAFSSPSFRNQIKRIAQGTKVYSISQKNFTECYIRIPEKDEQQRIVFLLSLIDTRISTQNKIIEKLESLIKGLYFAANKKDWQLQMLKDILEERGEQNAEYYPVFSVAVREGIIDQIEHLGRSFAAKDTKNYNVVKCGDIVYTKSPTGSFPYGIIKQSFVSFPVVVSPLYGVYKPKSIHVGTILHHYFANPINTNNYLHSLIQKGAKNTINISSQHFLDKTVLLPVNANEITQLSTLLSLINNKIDLEKKILYRFNMQKSHLLRQLFI